MTSYRSTPEPSPALFAGLLPAGEAHGGFGRAARRRGRRRRRSPGAAEEALTSGRRPCADAVRVASRLPAGLRRWWSPWKNDAKRLAKALDGVTAASGEPPAGGDLGRPSAASDASAGQGVAVLGEGDSLPDEGIAAVPLKLAKGLEFDRVIIPDASAPAPFPRKRPSRRRTASTPRSAAPPATITILSNGPLTPLLDFTHQN